MQLQDWVGLAGVPIVVGLVAALKPFISDRRFWPILALVLGLGLNVGIAYALRTDIPRGIVLGLIAGLASSGLWSSGKAMVEESRP